MVFALWLLTASAMQLPAEAAPSAVAAPRLTGAATPIAPALCEPIASETWRCAGLAGVGVRLQGPETERTLALGDDRPLFTPLPRPGRLSGTLQWHIDGEGRPVAATVRWRAEEGTSELVLVLRPATPAARGCVSAVLGPDDDSDAFAARRFRCGRDRAVLGERLPPELRAALRDWLTLP